MEDHDAAFRPDPCYLQTSVTSCTEESRVDIHPVFDRGQSPVEVEDFSGLPVDFFQLAWAALLRRYVAKETISFGLFAAATDAISRTSMHDESIQSRYLDRDVQLSICQYHIVSKRKWCDWRPNAYHEISEKEIENMQINTAIRQGTSGALETNRPFNPHSNPLTPWVDVEVNLGSKDWFEGMFLKTRSSKVPSTFARSIARNLNTLLVHMAKNREQNIGRADCVSSEDKHIITSWHPKELYANADCVHNLVNRTVSSKPGAEAICAWDGSLTYAELDAASSNVAEQLVGAGVDVGHFVALSFEKSQWAVVAALAILKAGGAFVPLDPNHPVKRLDNSLATIRSDLVVTSARFQAKYLSLGKRVILVSPQIVCTQRDKESDNAARSSVGPRDPAFVLFTSGSTGQPKGMVHEHGPVVSHAIVNGEAMGYHGRVFQFSAFTFDMAVWDMFSTLILGGCICIPSDEDRMNNIPQAMNRMRVDFAFLTPSVASLLHPDEVSTLKILACGGEILRQEIIQRWKHRVRLINQYGIAEVGTIDLRYLDRDDSSSRTETVGYPLPTLLCVLVDPEDHDILAPIGAIGELMVTGTTLSRGYINNEAKNRSSFIPNPAWATELGLEGRIFYKTGDLLQYNVGSFDGKYDFIKRKDAQIKFHGQRLEAGEVEHHLDGIPGVAVSAVVLPEQGCFSGYLVAVVQMSASASRPINREPLWIDFSQALPIETVTKRLSKSLPGYMVPTECLVIGNMPFTSSCKVDRSSVRAWLEDLASSPIKKSAAAIQIEISPLAEEETTALSISGKIAEMVASRGSGQAMQLQGQDFLLQRSGFDSIQTTSLGMFLQKMYGVKVPTSILFRSTSTVRDLARMVDQNHASSSHTIQTMDLIREVQKHSCELFEEIETFSLHNNRVHSPETSRNVFLTGASGYLGSGILQKLLRTPGVNIFILSRSPSITEALDKISRRAKCHGWWQEEYASRVHLWQGDLTEPGLGLSTENLERLLGKSGNQLCIDTIIHNGAKVHYTLDYETLKLSNLHPTKELLSMVASTANLSTFVYISGGRQPSAVEIPEPMDALQASHGNGYGQSKFVAEYLVRKCLNHPAFDSKCLQIVRPGYIIGSPRNGIANQTDFVWRLIAGCVEIGAYNEDEESHWIFVSDLERVSEIATSTLTNPRPSVRGIDPVLNGLHMADLWSLLKEDFGYLLKPLPQTQWMQSLETAVLAKGESHLLFPLLHALEQSAGKVGSKEAPPAEMRSCSRVRDAVRANVRHLIDVGFLQPPSKEGMAEASRDDIFGIQESDKMVDRASFVSLASLEETSSTGNDGSVSTNNASSFATSNDDDEKSYGSRSNESLCQI